MSATRRLSHPASIGSALFVTFLWSTSWILIRWGLDGEELQPITFAALRYGLASSVLGIWVLGHRSHREQVARLDRPTVVRVVGLGIVFYTLTQGAQFVAIANQPAATTSLVLSLTPLLVAGLAARSLAEPPSRQQLVGAVLVAAGAWLYFVGDLGATTIGMLAALVGLGSGAAGALLGRRVNRDADVAPVVITALSMAVGAAALIVVGFATEGIPTISARAWLIIVWLALVNTALAFTWWNLSLQRLSAVESAGINNTMLIQIALLAWVFLDEAPGAPELAGILAVSLGVLLTQTGVGWRTQTLRS